MSETVRLFVLWGWMVLTAIGVFITAAMMFLTRSDLKFLKEQGINGAVEASTRLAFGNCARAFVILSLLFATGFISFFAPHVPSTRQQPAAGPFNWAFIAFLYLVVITLDYSSFAVFRFRRRWLRGRAVFETKEYEGAGHGRGGTSP